MECRAINWTFTLLVGAYLDLAITFLLLCGSTLAYAASKFMVCFGMSLPCPCNGMFGDPNKDHCLQKFLVEHPMQNISAVQMSVMSKFPYSLVLSKDLDTIRGLMANGDGYVRENHDCLEGASFCNSAKYKSFGNEGASQGCRSKPKEWSRSKRRKRASCSRLSSSASNGHVILTTQDTVGTTQEIASQGMVPVAFPMVGDSEGVQKVSLSEGSSSECFSSGVVVKEIKVNNDNMPTFQECRNKVEVKQNVTHVEETAIRLLEQALEEEQRAHAALYVELEKERSAAASSADEAMAMILRLQEEKAVVEMGARQYKRMVEEKSVFDDEEMSLLKEILLRRERETHFLQLEVEAYRQMIAGNQWQGVALDQACLDTHIDSSLSQTELPGLKWNAFGNFSEQDDKFENVNDNDANAQHLGRAEKEANSAQEEMIVSLHTIVHSQNVEKKSSVVPSLVKEPARLEKCAFPESTIIPSSEMQEHKDAINPLGEVTQTPKKDNIRENSDGCDREPHVYDVHVVGSHGNMSVSHQPHETEHGQERIRMRRNSMSSFDSERLRIESEVGLLREKIRIVQKGREKLNLSLDQKEREKAQLQVLDDMAIQLQEIRNLTSPGSIARQASLPPQLSKWMSRKRPHQGSSLIEDLQKKEPLKEAYLARSAQP